MTRKVAPLHSPSPREVLRSNRGKIQRRRYLRPRLTLADADEVNGKMTNGVYIDEKLLKIVRSYYHAPYDQSYEDLEPSLDEGSSFVHVYEQTQQVDDGSTSSGESELAAWAAECVQEAEMAESIPARIKSYADACSSARKESPVVQKASQDDLDHLATHESSEHDTKDMLPALGELAPDFVKHEYILSPQIMSAVDEGEKGPSSLKGEEGNLQIDEALATSPDINAVVDDAVQASSREDSQLSVQLHPPQIPPSPVELLAGTTEESWHSRSFTQSPNFIALRLSSVTTDFVKRTQSPGFRQIILPEMLIREFGPQCLIYSEYADTELVTFVKDFANKGRQVLDFGKLKKRLRNGTGNRSDSRSRSWVETVKLEQFSFLVREGAADAFNILMYGIQSVHQAERAANKLKTDQDGVVEECRQMRRPSSEALTKLEFTKRMLVTAVISMFVYFWKEVSHGQCQGKGNDSL